MVALVRSNRAVCEDSSNSITVIFMNVSRYLEPPQRYVGESGEALAQAHQDLPIWTKQRRGHAFWHSGI